MAKPRQTNAVAIDDEEDQSDALELYQMYVMREL